MKKKKHKSRKHVILFYILAAFILLLIAFFLLLLSHVRIPFFPDSGIPVTPYVSASGTNLYVNGEPYQFIGINAFNLGSYTGNAGCGGQENNFDALFSKLRPNSTVRMWAFQGGMATNTTTKQTDWTGLDRAVAAAQKNGVKLILVLSDQSGTCDDGHWKDKAWYNGGYTTSINDYGNGLSPLPYLDYVKLIVSRYKDSTAIAMWEPVNEAEASDCQGAKGSSCYGKQSCTDEAGATKAFRSFFDTVGGTIKSIDPNHLVSSGVGGNGQCGAQFEDYQYVHASPGIDVASYHDYGSDDQPMPGDPYNGLQKRLNQMKILNKPLIVGEVGMKAMDNDTSCISLSSRKDKLKAKMDAQFKAGIAGFMPWALSNGVSTICNFDIGDNDPTLTLLHDYPVSMGTVHDTQSPTSPGNLTVERISMTGATLTWSASSDSVGVVRYDIFRGDNYFNSTTNTNFTITGLKPATTYTFFVKGKDAAGNNSDSSNRVTFTTSPDTQAPTAPTNLKVTSPAQVTLTWTASTDDVGVVRYDIFQNDSYLTSTTDTSITITSLKPGVTYTFLVKGKDAAGNNSWGSNRAIITTANTQP